MCVYIRIIYICICIYIRLLYSDSFSTSQSCTYSGEVWGGYDEYAP